MILSENRKLPVLSVHASINNLMNSEEAPFALFISKVEKCGAFILLDLLFLMSLNLSMFVC